MVIVHDDARRMDRTTPAAGDGTTAPVVLGRGCDLGAGAIVRPGVTVGQRAVVGAGAVVMRDVPPGRAAGGVPAHVIAEAD
jgi:acetyltransferase-like isoleucine patch superfamily enzyme